MQKRLILASASPRRKDMLQDLGVRFTVVTSPFQEASHSGKQAPGEHVCENARGKARAVAPRYTRAVVVGADTVVVYRGRVLGKPASRDDAFAYMELLNGRTHAVYT